MAAARINLKNIDYFKFKKLVIDGNRDDYDSCSKEVKSLCDSVQTLKFRDEEFDADNDRSRFFEICVYYKQILMSKRIDPLDVRIKSGWWGDHKNAYSAGKIKPAILKETLLTKAKDWYKRQGANEQIINKLGDKIDGAGLWVLAHKDHQCFQHVGQADKIFPRVAERLKLAFDGTLHEPLAALLIISMSSDWDFYFQPVSPEDDEKVLRVLENDLILKHDSIWPHGLNHRLYINSLLEVSEFRKSCIRHNWPPENDGLDEGDLETINLGKLRKAIMASETEILFEEPAVIAPIKAKAEPKKPAKERPAWNDNFIDEPENRASSPSAVSVASTHLTSASQLSSSSEESALSSRTITLAGPSTPRKSLPNAALKTVTRPQKIATQATPKDSPKRSIRGTATNNNKVSPKVEVPETDPGDEEQLEEAEVTTNGQDASGSASASPSSAPPSAPASAPASQTTSPTGIGGLGIGKRLHSRTPSASSVSSAGDLSQSGSRPNSPRKPPTRKPGTRPSSASSRSPARTVTKGPTTPRPTSAGKSRMATPKRYSNP